jgi:hypothetical protein
MQLHEKMVEIHPIWWPLLGLFFNLWSLVLNFRFLLKIYANYMKGWLKYGLFGGHQMCFGFPSCIELSLELKLKSGIN